MLTIMIAGKRIEVTDGNVKDIQSAIDTAERDLRKAVERGDKATKIALKWALRHLDDDAPEGADDPDADDAEEMVDCPQCDGSGKMPVAGESDKMVGCDNCDGKGKIKSSNLGEFGGEVEDDGEGAEMAEEAKADVDELEVEQETEKEAGKSHKDWKSRRDARRAKRRKDRAQRRKDGFAKFTGAIRTRVAFEARQRAALELNARKVLGEDADLTKLDDAAVKKAVIAKAFPEYKADGKSAGALEERYEMALEQAAAPAQNHADDARAGLRSPAVVTTPAPSRNARERIDAARTKREKLMQDVPFNRHKAEEHVAKKN